MIDMIAFDGDDTLWHCQRLYTQATAQFKHLFSGRYDPEWVGRRLSEVENANLADYGYGFKSFALSMIETAVEISDGPVPGDLLRRTIDLARQIKRANVQLMAFAVETLAELSATYALMLITKGDFGEQTSKIRGSGLTQYLRAVDIVGEKSVQTYQEILARHHVDPRRFLMVGDSLHSDIVPVIDLGGKAVYIPYGSALSRETMGISIEGKDGYYALESLAQLPALVKSLNAE